MGMIGNVHAEVVRMPADADIQLMLESQGIGSVNVTKKEVARAALVFGLPLLTLACNSTMWGIKDGRIGLGLLCAVLPLAAGFGFAVLGPLEKHMKGK